MACDHVRPAVDTKRNMKLVSARLFLVDTVSSSCGPGETESTSSAPACHSCGCTILLDPETTMQICSHALLPLCRTLDAEDSVIPAAVVASVLGNPRTLIT